MAAITTLTAASDGGPLTKRHRRDSSAGAHLLDVLSVELGITQAQTEQLIEFRDAIRKARALHFISWFVVYGEYCLSCVYWSLFGMRCV